MKTLIALPAKFLMLGLLFSSSSYAETQLCSSEQQAWDVFYRNHPDLEYSQFDNRWDYLAHPSLDGTVFYMSLLCDDQMSADYEGLCITNYVYHSVIRKSDCVEVSFEKWD